MIFDSGLPSDRPWRGKLRLFSWPLVLENSEMRRLILAIRCFFRALRDPEFARSAGAKRPAAASKGDRPVHALEFLALLQEEGRWIDFLREDISQYGDEQVGAAARNIHSGCRKALEIFSIEPVIESREGEEFEVKAGFDPNACRLVGRVVGNPPFRGIVRHRGWKATDCRFPPAKPDPLVLAPAEIELP